VHQGSKSKQNEPRLQSQATGANLYVYLESKTEIAKAQKALEATIRREFTTRLVKDIGWPTGRLHSKTLHTSDGWWFFSDSRREKDVPHTLNLFGRHGEGRGVQITVEVNVPSEGRHDSIAGFFARHVDTGRVYLFHSGRVGGGAKGVGKETFLAWSEVDLHQVVDSSGGSREGVMVMPVEGRWATRSALTYIQRIVAFKEEARVGALDRPEVRKRIARLQAYFRESSGRRRGFAKGRVIDYESRHGDVVDALAKWVSETRGIPRGGSLTKDRLIDLGVKVKGRLVEVWEVKSGTSRADLYTAIGQLSVHAPDEACRQTVVLPADCELPDGLQEAFDRLGVEVMLYRLKKDRVELLI